MKQFKEELSTGSPTATIPSELIEYFNQDLPDGLKYAPMGNNLLHVDQNNIKMTCYISKEKNEKWLSRYEKYIKSYVDVFNLMKITQTPLLIGVSDKVECDGVTIPTELLVRRIYDDKNARQEPVRYILPNELPSIECVITDSESSNEIKTVLKMQKSEDVEYITYNNYSDNMAFKISFTIPSRYYTGEENGKIKILIGVEKNDANDVKEAIKAYELYKAFINNQMCMNGTKIVLDESPSEKKEECTKEITINMEILKALEAIEEKLNVQFDLSEKIDEEVIEIILKLYVSIINDKAYVNNNKLENVSFTRILEGDELEKMKELKDIPTAFLTTGTLTVNLLGNAINMYYATCYYFVKLSEIIKIKNSEYKLVFDCNDKSYHSSSKIYLDEKTMTNETASNFNEYFNNAKDIKTIEETL